MNVRQETLELKLRYRMSKMEINMLAKILYNAEYARGIPKYVKLSDAIENMIKTGKLKAGDKLVSELEIAKALPFSLGTVQKALRHLTDQGLLERRHGSGTFVRQDSPKLQDTWHFRFFNKNSNTTLPVYTKTILIEAVREKGPWASFLGDDQLYIRIRRIIDVNHEFLAVSHYFLPGSTYSELLGTDSAIFDGKHLRDVLENKYGIVLSRVIEHVSAETFTNDICSPINLKPNTVGLVCRLYGFGRRDTPRSYQEIFVPPNQKRLEVREVHPHSE